MDIYDRLTEVVAQRSGGAPRTATLRRMLEIILTEEEASLACELPSRHNKESLHGICERTGYELETARALLESMADKGVAYSKVKDGVPLYALFPMVPGMFELQFMKGQVDERTRRIAELTTKYFYEGFGAHATSYKVPIMRTVAIQEEIPFSAQHVQPYEKIKDLILASKKHALATCYCRHQHDLIDKGCGKPKDVCMVVGETFSDFAVERGFARLASDEEMLIALERSEEAGLIHLTDNMLERAQFICNCCGCCCNILGSLTKLNLPGAVANSNYIISRDEELCVDCGDCTDRCMLQSLTLDEDGEKLLVNEKRCVGCGVCIRACEQEALSLVRRPEDEILVPYQNIHEMGLAVLKALKEPP